MVVVVACHKNSCGVVVEVVMSLPNSVVVVLVLNEVVVEEDFF